MRSILFFDKNSTSVVAEQTVQDLVLNQTISCVHRGAEAEAVVLSVLRTPCTNHSIIQNRQAVLQDFINNPGAIEQCLAMCKRITNEAEERRSPRYRMTSNSHGTDRSGYILAVQDDGEWMLGILQQYARMARFLQTLTLTSDPLCELRDWLINLVADSEYKQLCQDMAALSVISTRNTSYAIKAELTEDVRQITYRLLNIGDRIQLHKIIDDPERVMRIDRAEQLYGEQVVITVLRSLHEYLNGVAHQLTTMFFDLHEELLFYDFGVRYHQLLCDKGVPITWPTVTTESNTQYRELHDLYLTLHNVKPPIANDYYGDSLVVITGANNSGKTVFMRAVGAAQLFAQAGLPLPAKEAVVCMKRCVFTVYAVNEKDTGRFEEECRLLTDIVDTVTTEDLILFNEPFQSTAYKEGGELLKDVLDVFGSANISSVLVTHLLDLKEQLLSISPCSVLSYVASKPYSFFAESTY